MKTTTVSFSSLPEQVFDFMNWSWQEIEPYFRDLEQREIHADNVANWLTDWSHLQRLLSDTFQRLYVATTVDTTDKVAEKRYQDFVTYLFPQMEAANQKLKEKLLASGLEIAGFEIPLRNMRAEAAIFREANLPLLSQELKLNTEYDKIIGTQTVSWEGKEVTLPQLHTVYQEADRGKRECAWRLAAERQLADRQAINELWQTLVDLRCQLAENAGFSSYREYRWQQLLRFEYTPEDCMRFHQAIEEVAVPAAQRIYERRRRKLGLDTLRPWDLDVDPSGQPPLRPFEHVHELIEGTAAIFHQVDAQLGEYYDTMRKERLLDLDNRKGKAPGGYCTEFHVSHRPFIFMNAVGVHDDVQTILHEGGHAFHVFETAHLPYIQQLQVGMEFAEVASMAMELLASPYLTKDEGGFYSPSEAARARIQHLESLVCFWPYMAVVDAFQHWVYGNHTLAREPQNCDAKWAELWGRFMRGVDWSGLEQEMMTGWQRKLHIIQVPFYYVEYGLALLGALQVWRNALQDPVGAVAAYRRALSLGGTVPISELYQTAGAAFAFDSQTMRQVVELVEKHIDQLEQVAHG